MKIDFKSNWLILLTLLCGLVGLLLRAWLYGSGLGEDNLLAANHIAGILVVILSVAAAVALLLLTRNCSTRGKYADAFPACPIAAVGSFVGAAGILITSMIDLIRKDVSFAPVLGLLGIIAGAALVFTGYCRLKGRRPSFLFHTMVCLYFMLRLISLYQGWSADPQLHDYCFQLLAIVCIMLYAYHRAAQDLKVAPRRQLVLYGLLGAYFCCLSLVRSDAIWLYAGMAVWMLTNLGTLKSAPPRFLKREDR